MQSNKKGNTYIYWQEPKQKPYALYVHGFGSSASSATRSSFGSKIDEYEWLAPELSNSPSQSLAILQEWATTFEPALIIGTSYGAMLTLYIDCPNAIKVVINPALDMERTLRKKGYGKHPYTQVRENGDTHYIIDEPLIQQFIHFRQEHTLSLGVQNIALFAQNDEVIGREYSKKHAATLEELGFEILWSDKLGHRCNDQAVKIIQKALRSPNP